MVCCHNCGPDTQCRVSHHNCCQGFAGLIYRNKGMGRIRGGQCDLSQFLESFKCQD